MTLHFAIWKRFVEEYLIESTDRGELLVIANAVEKAKPIIDRIGKFGHPGSGVTCNCESCKNDRAAQSAFAEIDFSEIPEVAAAEDVGE